ncbi:nucleotidyltransferase family protein [Dyadobacter sandarakinus]|uniref:nucleotidyltransferase family protein n=1 Tax=Dyadobacter sandarakinus TaxID=2747268 RepID=UPI001E5F63FC|nr:nucleotidyltransferase family protein [Dyadobacter sandarakinus]
MHSPKVSAELQMLIDATLENEPGERYSDLQHINWKRIAKLAKWHQVRPSLFDFIPAERVPESAVPFYQSLKEFALGQAVANMAFLGLSVKLYDALQENGVPVFPMKGALWSWMLYKKPTNREFGDIDFFIERSSVRKSLDILAQYDFYPDKYRAYLLDQHEKDYLNTDYQLPLVPADEHTLQSLEVQWSISYPRYCYNLFWADLAGNMISFKMMQRTVNVPNMENQLLMMVVHHGGVEQWDKLKYLGDFVRLLRKFAPQLDWAFIEAAARSGSFYGLLVQSLELVKVVSGENYVSYLGPSADQLRSAAFITSTVGHWENARPAPQTKTWQIFSFNFKYRDGWECRLSLVKAHISYFLHWRLLVAKWKWYRKNCF